MRNPVRAIYLMETDFVEHYSKVFGADVLADLGFALEYWNVDCIVYGPAALQVDQSKFLASTGRHVRLPTKEAFLKELETLDPERSIILNFVNFSMKSFALYRAIGKRGIPYACILTGILPTDIPTIFSGSFSLRERLKEILAYAKKRLFRMIKDCRDWGCTTLLEFTRPKYVLISGLHAGYPHTIKGGRESKFIYSYCFEYDSFLKAQTKDRPLPGRYCVFVDQYVPFHPDYTLYGSFTSKPASEYYEPLNAFFDRIERELGLEVVIACHPKSDYESKAHLFKGRKILKGQTNILCRDSDLVLVHDSTAMNYAVIYDRPLVFLTSDYLNEVASCGVRESILIKRMASWLTDHVVDVNHLPDTIDWPVLTSIDKAKRRRFLDQFIRCPSAPLDPPFQQFAEIVRNRYELHLKH